MNRLLNWAAANKAGINALTDLAFPVFCLLIAGSIAVVSIALLFKNTC